MIKLNKKITLLGILSGFLIIGGVVYAGGGDPVDPNTSVSAYEVTYDNTTSGSSKTTVSEALIDLYDKANDCPEGYQCKQAICKRATKLHTETCTQTDATYYCSGAGYTASGSKGTTTITYGSLGTTGTLTSGDAFDCDVNGNGTYDQRFYYVTDLSTDSNYAVLIYYNNVSGGSPSNTTNYAYDSSGENWHGPVTAIAQLPTTAQWKNVSLVSTPRGLTNEAGGTTTTGGTLPTEFDYAGYAARLLTTQELESACGIIVGNYTIGELDNCNYLMENTKYSSASFSNGFWLETSISSRYRGTWDVYGYSRNVDDGVSGSIFSGVRPVIEILKTDISY